MARMIFSWLASRRRHFADDAPFVHDVDAVGDAEQFGHLRRDDDDRLTLRGEPRDDRVDLVFRADVDAARRLVEDQHFRIGEQPFRQHHLLLVAAGKIAGHLVDAGCADVGLAAIVVGDGELAQIVDHAVPRHAAEIGQRDVVLDVVDQVEAVGLAVLGDVGNAVLDRLAHRGDVSIGLPLSSTSPVMRRP